MKGLINTKYIFTGYKWWLEITHNIIARSTLKIIEIFFLPSVWIPCIIITIEYMIYYSNKLDNYMKYLCKNVWLVKTGNTAFSHYNDSLILLKSSRVRYLLLTETCQRNYFAQLFIVKLNVIYLVLLIWFDVLLRILVIKFIYVYVGFKLQLHKCVSIKNNWNSPYKNQKGVPYDLFR